MSRVRAIFAIVLALVIVGVTNPVPQTTTWNLRDSQLYSLRANSPGKPWNGRYLVNLPSTKRPGLENFTVHSETPPLKFLPIRLRDNDNKYALRGGGWGNYLSRAPLAALTNNATRTVTLKIVYLPTPLRESFETQTDACPGGYDCTADQWTLGGLDYDVYRDFRFGGFRGRWEPFKDVDKEGWHVHGKGNTGIQHPLQFDLVPVIKVVARID
ncbi:uncharacterized protein EKO05_0011070 [Ascochyta rabiei]|uniref:Uncharacterized protein n=1 Tax=Didymella rabiei TaxID=5454 RepID=A0A163LY95_DIDRA|nr:uncharacterized protein EKO05_0011070 [Ascochyta rabiei]KZM28229.1 hypothetical protein ST47_g644 [Ascochyta rabiei]UPX20853.1 hypothetical protein EKO05_0011070 [Ascochyta rabiei]